MFFPNPLPLKTGNQGGERILHWKGQRETNKQSRIKKATADEHRWEAIRGKKTKAKMIKETDSWNENKIR